VSRNRSIIGHLDKDQFCSAVAVVFSSAETGSANEVSDDELRLTWPFEDDTRVNHMFTGIRHCRTTLARARRR